MHSPEDLTELFRASGRKVTAQRQSVFRALQGNVAHPSAEAVYELVRQEVETISLKTVYQTLNDLAELGEIAALDLGTGTVRFDPNVESAHHHLVCRGCGKVRDLDVALPLLSISEEQAQGYEVASAEVVFRGYCEICRDSHSSAATANGR
jgi:Fe2+ or Zn2+ uptake regulation protein